MQADLNSPKLELAILGGATRPFRDLPSDTEALARRILRECCNYVVNLAGKMPNFAVVTAGEQLKRSTVMLEELENIFEELKKLRTQSANNSESTIVSFEDQYRRSLVKHLDDIELFGVKITGSGTRAYNLSSAYVPLTAVVGSSSDPNGNYALDVPGRRL
jgi:hypothetical protein